MDVLVVSQARFGVKTVVNNVLPRLVRDYDVECTYLSVPTNSVPEGCDSVSLLSPRVLDRIEAYQPLRVGYRVLEFWRRAHRYVGANLSNYDVVWYHNPRLLALAPAAIADQLLVTYHSRLLRVKARQEAFPKSVYYRVFGALECRGIAGLADARYTGVSPSIAADIRACSRGANRVATVRNGVDLAVFRPADDRPAEKSAWGLPDRPVLLSVGRLRRSKRPLRLLEVFEALRRLSDTDPVLVIAGDGPMRSAVEQAIAERDLNDVRLLGVVDPERMPALYRAADAFMLATTSDPGGPLALYEAAASGLPCFVPDIPTAAFVREHECGMLLDFDSPTQAAEKIDQALRAAGPRMGEHARAYAEEDLGWDTRVKDYYDVLSQVVSDE